MEAGRRWMMVAWLVPHSCHAHMQPTLCATFSRLGVCAKSTVYVVLKGSILKQVKGIVAAIEAAKGKQIVASRGDSFSQEGSLWDGKA